MREGASEPGKTAVIIGGGPAGLTAAYELLARTDVRPVVLEASGMLGGLARTERYKGNRIDIGGHRFFSKSDRVMRWWLDLFPLERLGGRRADIAYEGARREVSGGEEGPDPETEERVMLLRRRKSRIYFLRRLFDYPIRLGWRTARNLGPVRVLRILASYARARLFPIREEKNLEQFFVNRFGRELYETFFKSYTEKVWGAPCSEIDPAFGAQRVKGLSLGRAVSHALTRPFRALRGAAGKGSETSLIEQFLYPKRGPGQLWELCGEKIVERGGEIAFHQEVTGLDLEAGRVTAVTARDRKTGESRTWRGDHVISTMPVKDLVRALGPAAPDNVRAVAEGLVYRDFVTVGLLVSKLRVREGDAGRGPGLSDNWIYVQEPDVRIGRLQIFNNWSPYLVADPDTVWLGLEYFCTEGDATWSLPDAEMVRLGREELARIGLIEEADVLDATVIRVPKTYPAYLGTYARFEEIRRFVDGIENLSLVGRNGMHRYNNQDHSMLAAMTAVDNIAAGRTDKSNLWAVNTEAEYHEAKGEA